MARVLVTGGAGSVGRDLVARLAAEGHAVRAMDLPGCDYTPLESLNVEIVRGDIGDASTVRAAVQGVDTAVHLAALLPPASERNRDLTWRVNVTGAQCLIAALRERTPTARLIFSSSVCVYGDTSTDEPPIRVSHPLRPLDAYGESKAAAEQLVRSSGLPYTILRISGVSVAAFLAPPAVWPFTAEQRLEFVNRDDVVGALAACIVSPQAVGRILHIAGGPTWQMRGADYAASLNEVLGLSSADARYNDCPGSFDWYDTEAAEHILHYQRTPFSAFLVQMEHAIEQALGSDAS